MNWLIRWPKYWSFSFSISPSKKYSGLISLRIDQFDLPSAQVTLQTIFQHDTSKALIFQCSAFFMAQRLHQSMATGKTMALTVCVFVGKVMSLLFNILSRFFIALLPRNKHLLISWLQSLSVVILEPKKIKSVTASTFFPSRYKLKSHNSHQDVAKLLLTFVPDKFSVFSCFNQCLSNGNFRGTELNVWQRNFPTKIQFHQLWK